MKLTLRAITLMICCLFAAPLSVAANAQVGVSGVSCSRPVVLELIDGGNGNVKYRMSGKVYNGYPLDDLRRFLSGCQTSRPLDVIIDSHIPIGQISSAVAPKLQVDNVRYFIRYPDNEHLVIEIKLGDYLTKLP